MWYLVEVVEVNVVQYGAWCGCEMEEYVDAELVERSFLTAKSAEPVDVEVVEHYEAEGIGLVTTW